MNVLQPGAGPVDGQVYLRARPDTVSWGLLPNAASAPVLTVASGTAVTFDTVSHEGLLADQGRDPAAFFGAAGIPRAALLHDALDLLGALPHDPSRQGPHLVTGPVVIPGAGPGDVLEVEVLTLRRRTDYGVISNRHGRGALPGEYPQRPAGLPQDDPVPPVSLVATVGADGRGRLPLSRRGERGDLSERRERALRWELAPFLGIMGVAPATDRPVHSVPPGAHGGNLDLRLLTGGAKLYLPVQTEGALFYAGDPHFSQGDGEVALTAFEAPLRATLRLTLHQDQSVRRLAKALAGPFAETAAEHLVTGLDADLDEAARKATRAAIALLGERYGVPAPVALAYLSAACDLRISQVVDQVKGCHFRLPKPDLEELAC